MTPEQRVIDAKQQRRRNLEAFLGRALSFVLSALLWFLLMGAGGASLVVAGVYALQGMGWALIAAGVFLLLGSALIGRALSHE